MERHLFNRIITDVCNHDSYFVQKKDAYGVMGLLPEQKITATLRMLAKGAKSIILEAVASFDTWIWHAFFEVPGAQNDLNVFAQSPVFNDVLQGKAPKVMYVINGRRYDGPYYLADGIYPRKDVERCFGILQARWVIVKSAARMFDVESLRSIMMMCVILYNMIVEDEFDYDAVDEYEPEPDTMNNSRTRIHCAHDATEEPVQHEPLERDGRYNERVI
ncbi:uncharacterized protein [Malus domestica]|uniref:uncharacterized protein n=1 Tax=Malus domestica TaxID=3750 RepID=UPI00397557B9